jgi:hypothetical protein
MPDIDPAGLNDSERFIRRVAVLPGPNERMNGFNVVSRKARPNARIQSEAKKNPNFSCAAAG